MKTAKLSQEKRRQVARAASKFRKKSKDAVVLLPATDSWDSLINSLRKFSDDFMAKRKQPRHQKRAKLFS